MDPFSLLNATCSIANEFRNIESRILNVTVYGLADFDTKNNQQLLLQHDSQLNDLFKLIWVEWSH